MVFSTSTLYDVPGSPVVLDSSAVGLVPPPLTYNTLHRYIASLSEVEISQ